MKKILTVLLITILSLFCLAGCGTAEPDPVDSDQRVSEVTLYANGGTFLHDGEESSLSASSMDQGTTFASGIGNDFATIEKEGAEFDGWTLYAVADGEWVQDEVKDLENGQICVPCGHYGYYLMRDYEVISENMTTDDLLAYECDDRDYYGIVNWK